MTMTKTINILCVNIDEGSPDLSVIQVPEGHPLANAAGGEIDCDEQTELYDLWNHFDPNKAMDGSDLKIPCHIDQILTLYTY